MINISLMSFHFFKNVKDGFVFLFIQATAFWLAYIVGLAISAICLTIGSAIINNGVIEVPRLLLNVCGFIGAAYFIGMYKEKIIERMK